MLRSSSARFFFPSPTSDDSTANDVVANVADMVANQGVVSAIIEKRRQNSILACFPGKSCPTHAPPCDARYHGHWNWNSLQVGVISSFLHIDNRFWNHQRNPHQVTSLWCRVYFSEMVHRTGEDAADCAARSICPSFCASWWLVCPLLLAPPPPPPAGKSAELYLKSSPYDKEHPLITS